MSHGIQQMSGAIKDNEYLNSGQRVSKAAGSGRTSVCVWMMLLFREVLGWSVHQLPLLCAAVASVKDTASVLASSPRPQIRHGVPDRAETTRVSKMKTVELQCSARHEVTATMLKLVKSTVTMDKLQ